MKSPAESGCVTVGKGLDFIKNKATGNNDNYFGEGGKNFGGIAFEVADFILGVNGVRKGVKKLRIPLTGLKRYQVLKIG